MANEFVAKNGLISQNNTTISGSLTVSASSGIPLQIKGGAGTLLSISGSTSEIFKISDTFSPNLFTVTTGNITVFNIDNNKTVSISGSLVVTGSIIASGVVGLNLSQIASGSVTASVTPSQFSVVSGSSTEFIVTGAGVTIGNAITDTHSITGSASITGSLRVTGLTSLTATITGSAAATNPSSSIITIGGTITPPAVASTTASAVLINPIMSSSAATQTLVALDIQPTYTASVGTPVRAAIRFPNQSFIQTSNTAGTYYSVLGTDVNSFCNVGNTNLNTSIAGSAITLATNNSISFNNTAGATGFKTFLGTFNTLLQGGGTITDLGYRLQVIQSGSTAGLTPVSGTLLVSGSTTLADTYFASGSRSGSLLDMSQTWNITGAGTVTGIKYNITDTLSSAASLLMDLQVGGTSQFKVSKAGLITALGQVTSTNGVLNLGSSNVAISSATSRAAATAGRSLLIRSNLATVADDGIYIAGVSNLAIATGTQTGVTVDDTIAYASGTGSYNAISVPTTISSSVAASGSIVRGLYINPAFSSSVGDYRAIETTAGKNVLADTYAASGSRSGSLLDMTQTWNVVGGVVTGIKLNVTDTNSAANSLLMDLQTGGTSRFLVGKTGGVTIPTTQTYNGGLYISTTGGNSGGTNVLFSATTANNITATSGDWSIFNANKGFAPTSGTTTYTGFLFNATINQGAAASGSIVRGLYINPTLTSSVDFRGVEIRVVPVPTGSNSCVGILVSGSNTRGGAGYIDFLQVTNTSASIANPNKFFRLNPTGDFEIINSNYTTTILSLTNAGVLSTPGGGTSDARTKNTITYLTSSAYGTISQLKPVSFEFNNNPGITRHGFIAQDVLKVKPDLVLGDGAIEGGIYGLDYDGILALTVKALQEANNRIDALEQQISLLKG